jgi:hypothetical protein
VSKQGYVSFLNVSGVHVLCDVHLRDGRGMRVGRSVVCFVRTCTSLVDYCRSTDSSNGDAESEDGWEGTSASEGRCKALGR